MNTNNYEFSIIIPVFQELNILNLCLETLFDSLEYYTQIIIVDDGSPTSVRNYLHNLKQTTSKKYSVELIYHDHSRGSCFCINEAFRLVKGKYTLILDSDTIVNQQWQNRLIECFRDENIGCIGAVLLYPQTGGIQNCGIAYTNSRGRHLLLNASPEILDDLPLYDVQSTIFAFCAIKTEVIRIVGDLDIEFFNGYEDIDYQLRIRKAGYRICILPSLRLYHWERSNGIHRPFNRQSNLSLLWKKHGNFLKEDLWDFLFPALIKKVKADSYVGVDLCLSRFDANVFWQLIERKIPKRISENYDYSYMVKNEPTIWLPMVIPHDFFRIKRPILFLCENFIQMLDNKYWWNFRCNYSQDDIIVDMYGNVLYFQQLDHSFWPGRKIR